MHDVFVHPNWHIISIHYPLGLITFGFLIELFSLFWRRSTVRTAARWMILLGALAALPTVSLGMYALRDVAEPGPMNEYATWREIAAESPLSTEQWDFLVSHIWLASIGTLVLVLTSLIWLSCSDQGRRKLYLPSFLLTVAGVGLINASAWYGGEAVYRHGVSVGQTPSQGNLAAVPATQPTTTQASLDPTLPAVLEQPEAVASHLVNKNVEYYIQPLQLHVMLAGITAAIGLGAVGVTLRRWSTLPRTQTVTVQTTHADASGRYPGGPASTQTTAAVLPTAPVFPARAWLFAALFGIGTATAGLWTTGDWRLNNLFEPLRNEFAREQILRVFVHILFGASIVLLALLLALITRVTRRARGLVSLIMILFVLAVAGQIWLGTLLLFDSERGPITGFNAG